MAEVPLTGASAGGQHVPDTRTRRIHRLFEVGHSHWSMFKSVPNTLLSEPCFRPVSVRFQCILSVFFECVLCVVSVVTCGAVPVFFHVFSVPSAVVCMD